MTKDNLTKQQLSTLFLVNTINELVTNNPNEEIDCVGDVYFSLFHADRKDTIQLLKEILELEELGYIKTNYTKEDLQEEDEIPFLLDDTLSIKILADISAIKQELQITGEKIEEIIDKAWENEEVKAVCAEYNGKETFADSVKAFINSETIQNTANLINAVGSLTTAIAFVANIAKVIVPHLPCI